MVSTGHLHLLPLQAGKVHFDAVALAVVEGVVLEGVELEGAAQFAIDAHQQIEIELGGDAGRVVIGGVEHLYRLDQIDADDQRRARAQDAAGIAQERRRFVRLEIADGGARKEANPHGRGLRRLRQRELLGDVRGHRQHLQTREIRPQLERLLLDHLAADIDRHVSGERPQGAQQNARLLA